MYSEYRIVAKSVRQMCFTNKRNVYSKSKKEMNKFVNARQPANALTHSCRSVYLCAYMLYK